MKYLWFFFLIFSFNSWAFYPLFYVEQYNLNRRINLNQSESARWEKDIEGPFEHHLIRKQYTAFTALGIGPLTDTYVSSYRHHENPKAPELQLPESEEIFKTWQKKDWMFWKRDKGLVIYPVGPLVVGVLARITIAASYHVYLEKKSDNILYIEVRPGKLTAQSIIGALPISHIERTRMLETYKEGTAYHLDMTTPIAAEAFTQLIQGKIAEVEDLLAQNDEDGNEKIANTTYFRLSHFTQMGVTTPLYPLFSLNRRNLNQQTISTREDVWDQTDYEEEISSSSGRYDRAINYVRNEFHELTLETNKPGEFNEVVWSWNFETNHGNSRRIKRALSRLRKLIHCGESCAYNLPKYFSKNRYLRSSFSVRIPFHFLPQEFAALTANPGADTLQDAFKKLKKNKQLLNKTLHGQCLPVQFEVAGEKIKRWNTSERYCF